MTPISFPDDDIYEDGVVVSIQPDIYDEFSDQIQIQSLSIPEMLLLPKLLRIMSIFLQITYFSIYTNVHQLFVLTQISLIVDKYTNNYKYLLNLNNFLSLQFKALTVLIVMGLFYSFGGVQFRKLSCACRTVHWCQQHCG